MAATPIFNKFSISNQQLRTNAKTLLVEATKGVYSFVFEPSDEADLWETWESAGNVTAVFAPSVGQRVEVPVVDFQCEVPTAALAAPFVRVGIYAKVGNKIYPTEFSSRLAVEDGTFTAAQEGGEHGDN